MTYSREILSPLQASKVNTLKSVVTVPETVVIPLTLTITCDPSQPSPKESFSCKV